MALGDDDPFVAPMPIMPPAPPQKQPPLGSLGSLAGMIAPFFMPGVPTGLAAANLLMPEFVQNPVLMAAIMSNQPGGLGPAGPEWSPGAAGDAARLGMDPISLT